MSWAVSTPERLRFGASGVGTAAGLATPAAPAAARLGGGLRGLGRGLLRGWLDLPALPLAGPARRRGPPGLAAPAPAAAAAPGPPHPRRQNPPGTGGRRQRG